MNSRLPEEEKSLALFISEAERIFEIRERIVDNRETRRLLKLLKSAGSEVPPMTKWPDMCSALDDIKDDTVAYVQALYEMDNIYTIFCMELIELIEKHKELILERCDTPNIHNLMIRSFKPSYVLRDLYHELNALMEE
jgi:hypothetical protein